MKNHRLTLEEFAELFRDKFESRGRLLKEYESYLATFEQLDQSVAPELSAAQKADIFRTAWLGRAQRSAWLAPLLNIFRQPALTFAIGIALGCLVMASVRNDPINIIPTSPARELLEIERTRFSQTYKGKIIDEFYPDFENPVVVSEQAGRNEPPQKTVYGTLDNGEIYVVLNL